jgi:hypothetical protein
MVKNCFNKNLFISIFIVVFFLFLFGLYSSNKVEAIICATGFYCTSSTQDFGVYKWVREGAYESGGCKYIRNYTCNGDDNACEKDWIYVYSSYDNCLNKIGAGEPHGCCLEEDSCIPSCSAVCPTGTTSTDTGDLHSTVGGGGDGCGGTCSTDNCYCEICTPSDSCEDFGFSTTSQGYGLVPESYNPSCRNGESTTPDRAILCDITYSSCYLDCYEATCSDLQDEVEWLNELPAGATRYRTYNGPVPITTTPSGYAPSVIGCPTEQNLTCYTLNDKPEIDVWALSDENNDSVLEYSSATYTGRTLNNPTTVLKAEYTDVDGQDDIRKIYIWWKTSGSPILGKTIDNSLASKSLTDSFGLLVTRDASGAWSNVYVPNITAGVLKWKLAGQIGEDIYIGGPTPQNMVQLSNMSVVDDTNDGNKVIFSSDIKFLIEPVGSVDIVETGQYGLWGMADDYVVEVLDDTAWIDSTNNRYLDMVDPTGAITSISDTGYGQITLNMEVNDDDSISYIRLDACKDGADSGENLIGYDGIVYPLPDCTNILTEDGYPFTDMTVGTSLLGTLGGTPSSPLNRQKANLPYNPSVDIQLGENKEGTITFYLTVMDMAGNNNSESQDNKIYRLEQWAVVEDGLVFGRSGVSSSTRLREDSPTFHTTYSTHPVLSKLRLEPDLTNHVLLSQTANLTSQLRDLVKTSENDNFKATGYSGIDINLPYAELVEQYENKRQLLTNMHEETDIPSSINTDYLTTTCGTSEYCILRSEQPLTIQSDFVCNTKVLILVNSSVTIQPNLTNLNENLDALIIVARDGITIEQTASPAAGIPTYNQVNAFLITDGTIEIPTNGTQNDKGLFVEGGLIGFTTVDNTREIQYGNMGTYPVVVVKGNSKYGLLSRELFGSQIEIYQSEIGFKPY